MYPFVVKVKYWDDFEPEWTLKHVNILVYADTFAEAASMVENGYIDHIESIKVMACGEEGQFFEVSGEIAKALIEGGGNYKFGINEMRRKNESDRHLS